YITGENREAIENSPHLEFVKNKGYNVLFLIDRIDEFILPYLMDFKEIPIKSVEKADIEIDTTQKEETSKKESKYKELFAVLKENLKDEISEVKISSRLTESVSCLVAAEDSMTKNMEQMLKSMGQAIPKNKRILEINPNHAVLNSMQAIYSKNKKDPQIKDFALLLYNQALLTEGSKIKNSQGFAKIINNLLIKATK
ncbi:heat shock protein 90, partial [Candidatus Magnetomorum sp. HK-1]